MKTEAVFQMTSEMFIYVSKVVVMPQFSWNTPRLSAGGRKLPDHILYKDTSVFDVPPFQSVKIVLHSGSFIKISAFSKKLNMMCYNRRVYAERMRLSEMFGFSNYCTTWTMFGTIDSILECFILVNNFGLHAKPPGRPPGSERNFT